MSRTVNHADRYEEKRIARLGAALPAADKAAAAKLPNVTITNRHPWLRDLAAKARHQLNTSESTSRERQAVRARLGRTEQ